MAQLVRDRAALSCITIARFMFLRVLTIAGNIPVTIRPVLCSFGVSILGLGATSSVIFACGAALLVDGLDCWLVSRLVAMG